MPLGRHARRLSPTHANLPALLALMALGTGSAGCNSMPAATRLFPRAAEVRTREVPDRPATSVEPDTEPLAGRKLELDRLDEESPLPPAMIRPAGRIELAPTATPIPTATSGSPPIIDDAIARTSTEAPPPIEPIGAITADEPKSPPATITLPPPDAPKVDPAPPIQEAKAVPVALATPVPESKPPVAPAPARAEAARGGLARGRPVSQGRGEGPRPRGEQGVEAGARPTGPSASACSRGSPSPTSTPTPGAPARSPRAAPCSRGWPPSSTRPARRRPDRPRSARRSPCSRPRPRSRWPR